MFRIMLAVVILVAAGGGRAAEHSAQQAIEDAVALLESRQQKMSDDDALRDIQRAIDGLRSLIDAPQGRTERRRPLAQASTPADAPPKLAVNVIDFIDSTERYKGQVITLPVTVRSLVLSSRGQSLRDLVGGSARFRGFAEDGTTLDVMIDLPAELAVPKASFGDLLMVTFRCRAGDLRRGNQAIAIKRPGQE